MNPQQVENYYMKIITGWFDESLYRSQKRRQAYKDKQLRRDNFMGLIVLPLLLMAVYIMANLI